MVGALISVCSYHTKNEKRYLYKYYVDRFSIRISHPAMFFQAYEKTPIARGLFILEFSHYNLAVKAKLPVIPFLYPS
ncbi:hypothetical protein WQ57_02465 [Mesobacillus campisalis]|uniref:Uncharacterized protein n=1 Tax=Mesobacillus campisalis TaxID=1408103 RepID=A0A0M2T2T0_9BACI|nr:hypothetical protein WQ57_02465 [Mesobacillus campisalis]